MQAMYTRESEQLLVGSGFEDAMGLEEEFEVRQETFDDETEESEEPHNREIGRRGEEAAELYLIRRGYEILERNWTCQFGEADIVAQDFDTLIFVEVKTRTRIDHGFPQEAVTFKKRRKYEQIAMAYLKEHDFSDMRVRFDVVAIMVIGEGRALIRHYINAFGAVS